MKNYTRYPLLAFAALIWTASAHADSTWSNVAGGDFGTGGNWTGGLPGITDAATFDLDETYTVDFDGDYTNDRALVSDGVVTYDLSTFEYELTNTGSSPVSFEVSGASASSASLTVLGNGTGTLSTERTRVGTTGGGTGNLTVSNTTWNNANTVVVGTSNATGNLLVDGGSTVVFGQRTDIGSGGITASGAGTSLTYSTLLYLAGVDETAVFNLSDGATASVGSSMVIGSFGGFVTSGEVNVTGGSVLTTTTGAVSVGIQGQVGTINISGADSEWDAAGGTWTVSGYRDGNAGAGTINITDGGVLSLASLNTGSGNVGADAGLDETVANITVDGAGSELNLSSLFRINRGSSTGTTTTQVTVSNGGTVDANGTIYLAENGGGSGTIEVNSGGTFDGRDFIIGSNAGSEGHLIVTGAGSTASTSNSASIKVGEAGTGVMDILNGGAVTTTNGTPIIGNLAGSNGTVNISGTDSRWTLSGGGTGSVTVGGIGTGSLNVRDGGSLFGSATVGSTGSLGGDGTITGNVTNSGLVTPGNSSGILTINGDYSQTNVGILQIELGGTTVGTEYDQLFSASGTANLDGTLNLLSISSFDPSSGDSFQILNFSTIAGSFDTINTFNLDSGLAWNFDNLYTTGTIDVIAVPEPATAASLLGALALGLALIRRRR